MNILPLPFFPESLRGRSLVVIKGCCCGKNPECGEELFRPIGNELGQSIKNTFGVIPAAAMDAISKDPVDSMGVLQYNVMLFELSDEAIDIFEKIPGPGG